MSLKKKALICCLTAAMSTGMLTTPVAHATSLSQGSTEQLIDWLWGDCPPDRLQVCPDYDILS